MQTPSGFDDPTSERVTQARGWTRKAILFVWLAFIFAFATSGYLRWYRTNDAAEGLAVLASMVAADAAEADIVATAESLADRYFGEQESIDRGQFQTLVRVLAYEIDSGAVDLTTDTGLAQFESKVLGILRQNLLLLLLIHGAILASFPAFFTMTALAALRHIRRYTPAKDGLQLATRENTFWNAIWTQRHLEFLRSEKSMYAGRRLGFAFLVSLSLTYMLAPTGLFSSAIGEYVALSSLPGRASNPFWFAQFAQASPFVLGLLGFLVYSLLTVARRSISFDVNSRLFLSLWNRGITVVILSLVLTAVDEGSSISRALIFVAGVFPETGLQAIGKLAQTGADRLAQIQSTGLTESLPEIDSIKEGSLRELDIYSVSDLAQTDLNWLMVESGIHPRVLLKAMDRALLLDRLGALDEQLKKIPVFTASDLVLFVRGRDAYAPRWQGQPPRELAAALTTDEQNARLELVEDTLQVKGMEVHVQGLLSKQNLAYIIDNRLGYADL